MVRTTPGHEMACDLGYIIRDHVCPLMQVVTNRLREYNMQLLTTKCLNTAVMIMYLMLSTSALAHTTHCDVPNVRSRSKVNPNEPRPREVAAALRDEVLRLEPGGGRTLIYVMITDGDMPRQGAPAAAQPTQGAPAAAQPTHAGGAASDDVYFPGHVFVIEKLAGGARYNLYQSYINFYDLGGHITRNGGALSVGRRRMQGLMAGMASMMTKGTWDGESSKFWTDFTNTPPPHALTFEGRSMENLLMCFRAAQTDVCVANLAKLVDDTQKELHALPDAQMDVVYGDPKLYTRAPPECKPLTNRQILAAMDKLSERMQ